MNRAVAPVSGCPRPKKVHFVPEKVLEQWGDRLALHHAGFAWDGSSSPLRSMSGYKTPVAKCVIYISALAGLIAEAPTGFPAHNGLITLLSMLHSSRNIFGSACSDVPKACEQAAFAWRDMCRTLYDLKKTGTHAPELAHVVDTIELPSCSTSRNASPTSSGPASTSARASPAPAASATTATDTLSLAQAQSLLREPIAAPEAVFADDDDVQIMQANCLCEKCRTGRNTAAVAESNAAATVGAVVAVATMDEAMRAASPKIGGQRLETKPPPPKQNKKENKKVVKGETK